MGMIEVITQTVVFLFAINPQLSQNPQPIGTGFLVQYSVPSEPQKIIPVIVTAKHVIADHQKVYARFSTKTGENTAFMEYNIAKMKKDNDYWEHSDDGVDIAIFRTTIFEQAKIDAVPIDYIASKEVFKNVNIQQTDSVKFPGLLVNFLGSNQNYPILKDGSIALIPREKVPLEYLVGNKRIQTNQEIILLNAISIPGLSGAPIFLWPGERLVNNTFDHNINKMYLIGIMHGFYPAMPREIQQIETSGTKSYFGENSGIAIVFPSYKILEIFDQQSFKKRMAELFNNN